MSNPYELRFQIFEAARSNELEKFYNEKEKYQITMENLTQSGIVPEPGEVKAPVFPTLDSILESASIINDFVSTTE